MGIITKQGTQATLSSYIGLSLGFFSFLVLFPLLLSKEQIGLIRVIEESTAILATLALLGSPGIGVRYFNQFKNPTNGNNGFLRLLLLFPLIGIFIVGVGMYLLSPTLHKMLPDPLLHQYWGFILPITIASMFFIILDIYCRCNYLYFIPAFLRDTAKRIIIIIAALALWFGFGTFNSLVIWVAIAHFIILLILIIYMWNAKLLDFKTSPFKFINKDLKTEMVDVAFFQTMSVIGGFLLTRLDTFMVLAIAGLADTGVYSISAKLVLLMDLPRTAIQVVALTLVAQSFKENNIAKIESLYKQTSLNQCIVGCVLLLVLWCNIDSIFAIIPNGAAFKTGKIVMLYLGIAKLIDMSFGVNYEILAFSKHYRVSAFLNLLLMFCAVFINYFFINKYGFVGAGMAAIIIVLLFNCVRGAYLWHKLKLQPFHKNIVWALLSGTVVGGLDMLIPHYNSSIIIALVDAFFHSAFIISAYLFLIIKFQLSSDVSVFYFKIWNRIKLFF